MLEWQQTAGNRAVSGLMTHQARAAAAFEAAGSPAEAERAADAVADAVAGTTAHASGATHAPAIAASAVDGAIRRARQAGQPLDHTARAAFNSRFDADLGAVRVHTGAAAGTLARSLNARAFTHGTDLYFAPGHYAPHTQAGRHLIAHELTHVMQQQGQATPQVQCAPASPSGQFQQPGAVAAPALPTNPKPTTWSDAEFAAYMAWAAEIQQRPPAAAGIGGNWRTLETGRAVGYLGSQVDDSGIVFSGGKTAGPASDASAIDPGNTTSTQAGGTARTTRSSAWVDLPAFSNASLAIRTHAHVMEGGGIYSYADACNFFNDDAKSPKVEFVFDRRVDLGRKADRKLTGVIYAREELAAAPSLAALDTVFAKQSDGSTTPLTSLGMLADVLKQVDPTCKVWRFSFTAPSSFQRTEVS